jgi:hypothetical protein
VAGRAVLALFFAGGVCASAHTPARANKIGTFIRPDYTGIACPCALQEF